LSFDPCWSVWRHMTSQPPLFLTIFSIVRRAIDVNVNVNVNVNERLDIKT